MAKPNPYKLGEKVLASRAQDGENHEEAAVVDVYSLLMQGDEQPMIVVEFPDEKRVWLKADGPDVLPMPEDEEEDEEEKEGVEEDDDADGEAGEEDDDG